MRFGINDMVFSGTWSFASLMRRVREILSATVITCIASTAQADEGPAAMVEEATWAARACYLEASWRESDCVALLWVLRKRAQDTGDSLVKMLREYSAIDANNPRAREVREYPWGDIAEKTRKFNERWQHLREVVMETLSGLRPDPCPRARHWGGKMDAPQGRMVPARCNVTTANTFYALRPRALGGG